MPKEAVLKSSDVYSRVVNSQYPSGDFWGRMKLKWNGGHQLLPTTDSPTISACTTSTNLSGLEFQSSSTINKFLLERNLREKIPEIEPLQPRKIDMSINSGKQELENSDEQLCQPKDGKSSLQFCNIFRPLQSRKIDMSVESRKQVSDEQACQMENGKVPFQLCDIYMQENSDEQLCKPENEKSSLKFCNISRQVIAAIAVSWVSMVIGYVSGYTSPAEISLKDELKLTDFQFSWISGLMPLAAMFGGLLGGPLIENLGRKRTIIVTDLLFLLGWIFNYFAQQYWYLYVSRTVSGCAVGIASLTLPVYLGETIQPEVRGTLGLLPTAFGNIGILLCFSMGFFLQWKNIAGVGALLTIPFLLLFWIIPETPRWYISKGRIEESRKALEWLRGKGNQDVVDKEFEELLKTQKVSDEKSDKISDLFTRPNVKSLLIVLGLMFFQQLTGINAVIFYTTQIFEDTGSTIPSAIQTIIVGAVNFAATFIATVLIDRLGRKVLLYISSIAVIITLAVLGVYFYLLDVARVDVSSYSWVPLASFVVYVLGFSFGFGPVPWLMMGEILPAKIRGPAASVSTGFNWTCTFVVTTTFPLFKDIIGAHGAFWLFCAMTIIGLVFTILVVPETKGQSLEDIERKLAGVKVRRRSSVVNMKTLPSTF